MSVPHRGLESKSELLFILKLTRIILFCPAINSIVVMMHQTLSQPTLIILEKSGDGESDRSTVAHSSGLRRGFLTRIALVRTTVTK